MTRTPTHDELMTPAAIVSLVRAELDKLDHEAGPFDSSSGWFARRRELIERMVDRIVRLSKARVEQRWDGARVRLLGFAATSTSGVDAALRNWLAAAEKRGITA